MILRRLLHIASALALTTVPAFAQQTVPSSYFGNHVLGPLETNINGTGVRLVWPSWTPTTIRLLNTYGFSTQQQIYTGTWWKAINTAPGVYDWTVFDAVLAKLKSNGVTDIVYSFQAVPQWACSCASGDLPPTNMQNLTDFATAIARRAIAQGMAIRYYEVWNEPNSGNGYWHGTTAQMVTMAQTIYNAIKAVDPTYKVLTPAPQGNSTSWTEAFLAAGGGQYADIMSFHGYTSGPPEVIESLIDQYKAVYARYGQSGKPMWDTEAMDLLSNTNAAGHAKFLAINYLLHWVKGVERFYWYSYADDVGAQWSHQTGLNIAGQANIQVRNWMLGSVPGQLTKSGGVYTLPLTKNGVASLAVWNSVGPSVFSSGTYTQAIDLQGTTRAISGGSVTIGQAPILLTAPATTPIPVPIPVPTPTPTPIPVPGPPPLAVGTRLYCWPSASKWFCVLEY